MNGKRYPRRIRDLILLALTLFLVLNFIENVAGSVTMSLLMQPYTTVKSPPVKLEQGTAGSSTIYTNNTSAKVSAAAPVPLTYNPNSYNVVTGTYVSGSVPSSVQTVDTNYFIVRSAGTSTSTTTHYPSGYNLNGSTKYVSGALTDLQTDNSAYMTFRSYVSTSSTTAKTNAFVAYRDSTTSLYTPKERTWTGDTASWGSPSEMATAGSAVRFARVAYSPIEQRSFEKIVVTLSDNGYLDAYVWDGTSWSVKNDIGNVGTTANAYKCFDVAYEKTSGEALLVYSIAPATNFQVGYNTWSFTSGWSVENTYVMASGTAQTAYWISMASKPTNGANEIAVGVIGDATSLDAYGLIWNGASFSSQKLLTGSVTIATMECIAVAYEQSSGYATFVSSIVNDAFSWQWSGSAWDASATTFDLSGTSKPYWFTLKANPINDELFCTCVDAGTDLNTAYWSGTAWTLHSEHDASVDTDAQRCADFAWEQSASKGLLVWGTLTNATAAYITYRTFTAPNTWGTITNVAMGGANNIHPWVQLKSNTRSISGDVKILGIVMEGTVFDIGAIKWDGTTFTVIGTNTISSDTTVITYECFEIKFQRFGPPTEFTSEVEFTGASNTETWAQLVWTIDSAWNASSVSVTIQVYNYTAGGYPNSGNGYDSYTSSSIANTDETKTKTITINPTHFRNGTGYWKIKVKGVKTPTTSQFGFKADLVEFKPSYYTEYTVSTEFLFSGMTSNTPTQLNFTVVSEYNTTSVSVTIQVWNYSSPANYVTSGEGYLQYTSNGVNETKLLSINTNPQFYTSSGAAKIKITGVKNSTTPYQQKTNQVKLVYSYSSKYDYVLKIVQVSDSWEIRLNAYSDSQKERLKNCTIYFRSASDDTSNQVSIINGAYTKQFGDWYDLPVSAERYIVITLQANNSGTSYVYVYLEIRIPDKTTYAQYVITFEIT